MQKKKSLSLIVIAVIIAFLSISSYFGFGNGSSTLSTTSTIKSVNTFPVKGEVNGIIVGYSSVMNITYKNQSILSNLSNTLSEYSNNGIISTFSPEGNGYLIYTGSENSYQIEQSLYNLFSGNQIKINGTAIVSLGKNQTLNYGQYGYNVYFGNSTYQIQLSPIPTNGSKLNLSVIALVAKNTTMTNQFQTYYSIYNKNIEISVG